MIHSMYSSSEITGSMFDDAVLSRLVLRCGHFCVNSTITANTGNYVSLTVSYNGTIYGEPLKINVEV
jgi:hypothetical protein